MAYMTVQDMATQVLEVLNDSADHSAAAIRAVAQTIQWLESNYNLKHMKHLVTATTNAERETFFPYHVRDYVHVRCYDPDTYSNPRWVDDALSELLFCVPEEVGIGHYTDPSGGAFKPGGYRGRVEGIPTRFSHAYRVEGSSINFAPASIYPVNILTWHPLALDRDLWKVDFYPEPDRNYVYEIEMYYKTPYILMVNNAAIMQLQFLEEANELIEAGALFRLASRTRDLELKALAKTDFDSHLEVFMSDQTALESSEIRDVEYVYEGENRKTVTDYRAHRVDGSVE
jgi:hypothetical protein